MSLSEYLKKRDFKKTSEPFPQSIQEGLQRFVIQKHRASHLHYDFRLELFDDESKQFVLKSWAIPKNIPLEEGKKHLAIQTEDHPVEYLNFEGKIPAGNYGAGEVEIWDKGRWGLMKGSLAEEKISFNLLGKKVKGRFLMVKTRTNQYAKKFNQKGSKKNNYWLIWKKGDEF